MVEFAGHHAKVATTPDQASLYLEDSEYDVLFIGQPRGGFCPYAVAEDAKRDRRAAMRIVFVRVSDEPRLNGHYFDAVLDVPYSLTQLLGVLNTAFTVSLPCYRKNG